MDFLVKVTYSLGNAVFNENRIVRNINKNSVTVLRVPIKFNLRSKLPKDGVKTSYLLIEHSHWS